MLRSIRGTIDSQELELDSGVSILTAAKGLGIEIPTLCHHEGLPPDGNCRVCLAEADGKLVASCMYPIRNDGFKILTNSPRVREARAFVIYLLLNRAPKAPRILNLAEAYGVSLDKRFQVHADDCIRCARCVRVCKLQASEAISLVGRSSEREVTGPFHRPPEDCVGCLSCAINCPTGRIRFKDDGLTRTIWDRDFQLIPCPVCGERHFTKAQLDFFQVESPLCPRCRREKMAKELLKSEYIVEYRAAAR